MSNRNDLMRHEITRAASRLFQEKAISRVTLTDVAKELDLTKAALYHYFDTKEDLLRSVFTGWATACRAPLEAIAASPLEPEEMLRQIVRTHVQQITGDFGLYVLSVREESNLPETVRQEFRHLKRDTDLIIRDVIEKGQAAGVFRSVDARLAELACIGMFNWMWKWYNPDRDDPVEIAELFIRIFMDGIRVRPSESPSWLQPAGTADTSPASTADYHMAEIRYHTEALNRVVQAATRGGGNRGLDESPAVVDDLSVGAAG